MLNQKLRAYIYVKTFLKNVSSRPMFVCVLCCMTAQPQPTIQSSLVSDSWQETKQPTFSFYQLNISALIMTTDCKRENMLAFLVLLYTSGKLFLSISIRGGIKIKMIRNLFLFHQFFPFPFTNFLFYYFTISHRPW